MSEISKAYEPQAVEAKWYQFWLDRKLFVADPASPKPAYSIVIPPPNVTGVLTMGHVLNNTIQDILARKARMDGKEVLWLPGTDHAGIATQTAVERALKKQGIIKHRNDLGRDKFLEKVWEWKEKHGGIIIEQLKKLGASCDWTRERFTMDPEYSRCVQKVFVELYKKGLIYRGKRMVNWDPAAQTALSDEEVIMKEQKGFLYYFKVEVAEEPGKFLTIATTRPETIPGDTAVAVNPKDSRYTHLIGKHVVRPLPAELPREKKLIPIIGDEHVDFEFGTGVLKVTPAHDKADFEIAMRDLKRLSEAGQPIRRDYWALWNFPEVIDERGFMTAAAGQDLFELDRFKARAIAAEKLTALGLMEKEEPYTNNVGFSERTDVPIEPRLSEQWFLKYPRVEKSHSCVAQDGFSSASNLSDKTVKIVRASGNEISGTSIRELRKAALIFAREHHFLGIPFKNENSGIQIRVGRQSLSHAYSNLGVANILAVAVLPELIRTAIWISSEPHEPRNPMVKAVHRFVAALLLAGDLHSVLITAKEFFDGTILYDHKAKKITFGGKSLEAHLPEEKLDTQPAPNAEIKVSELLAGVKIGKMRFHPQRWAKVYGHWMAKIQDWCISRQLWWGHRIPAWKYWLSPDFTQCFPTGLVNLLTHGNLSNGFEFSLSGVSGHSTIFRFPSPEGRPLSMKNGAEEFIAATGSELESAELKRLGFEQDPDVLDTWFSSWLWPFATMGWPEQTPTLKKFYPTTDLVTGPDIIFFWVARMIMAGYEFMGDLPFHNVYFTGIIRDKQGRKMSKSLGNSPDPLDLIAKYGADALRFGVMRSAPLGQDILFDEQHVELGRNFCNKLWNACRFRQMQGGEVQGEIEPKLLTGDDRWILLKLHAAIQEITASLGGYNFSEAAQTLYRFFWGEFCDWYLEASKAALQGTDEALKANTVAVLDFVLSHTLRLFHPFLPFITEELWHGMGYHEDMPENQGGQSIMHAPWPKAFDAAFLDFYGLDDSHLALTETKYELVRQGRNLRREANIPSNKKVRFILRPSGEMAPGDVAVLRILLNADPLGIDPAFTPQKGTPAVHSPLGELYLPLEGVVDVAAEKARLNRELEKIEGEIGKVQQKLANPAFTENAPPEVLSDHRKRLADWEAKKQHVLSALRALD